MTLEQLLLPVRQWRVGREPGIFTTKRVALPLLVGSVALCIELLALARVFVPDAELLLLDESASGLEPELFGSSEYLVGARNGV